MVVGLTGTGKSTTLARLGEMRGTGTLRYCDDIPDRRELADLIVIPTAQAIAGEEVRPVKDREQRFELTRRFAQQFNAGGSAAVYGWLYYQWDGHTPLLSDGLRGPGEIAYALKHYPRWQVCEDRFDFLANSSELRDLSFLPKGRRLEVMRLLESGEVTPKAVITARAEAQNYGGAAYDADNRTPRYRCIQIDDMTPDEVAKAVVEFMQEGV
jgi:hypothetical protein